MTIAEPLLQHCHPTVLLPLCRSGFSRRFHQTVGRPKTGGVPWCLADCCVDHRLLTNFRRLIIKCDDKSSLTTLPRFTLRTVIKAVWMCFWRSFEQFSKPGCINPDVQRQTIEALLASASVPSSRFLRPEFIRLAPPLHTSDDEVHAQQSYLKTYHFTLLLLVFTQPVFCSRVIPGRARFPWREI